jgi:crotonobetainyl-CoA:carnitine CoA-transferase CaiB-like acyl-CoA transferase
MHPLEGIRVIDLTTMINGPYLTLLLSDMGAEVVKVEPPDGDPWRIVAGGFIGCNRGKRDICIDLKKDNAKEVMAKLIQKSDILVENARWGVWKRLGLDYESVKKINPNIIYVSVLGHGSTGPLSEMPGYDPLLQARSGQSVAQGGLGKPPVFHIIPLNDMATPMLGAYGAMLALLHKIKTGKGQRVECSLTNASISLQSGDFIDYPGMKRNYPGDDSFKGFSALHQLYGTSDGRWISLIADQEKHWPALCDVLGREDQAENPHFSDPEKRVNNDAELMQILSDLFNQKPAEEWVELLTEKNIPAALVRPGDEMFFDPHCEVNHVWEDISDPELGAVRVLGVGPKFSFSTGILRRGSPQLGQHTTEIMAELGYSADQIQTFIENKTVYPTIEPE